MSLSKSTYKFTEIRSLRAIATGEVFMEDMGIKQGHEI